MYLEIGFDTEKYNQDGIYAVINAKLHTAGISLQVERRYNSFIDTLDIQKQLMSAIYDNITGHKLNEFIKPICKTLAKKYEFKQKDKEFFSFEVQSLISNFHSHEVQTTKNKALIDTLLFCLFIVTIPFAKLFYNSRCRDYAQDHFYESMFVDYKILDAHGKPRESYGLLNKLMTNKNQPDEKIIFNEKGNVRKFLTISEDRFHGRKGPNFLGTKTQLDNSKRKFENSYNGTPNHENNDDLIKFHC